MDHTALRSSVWDAMKALPRPVDKAKALAAVLSVLNGIEATQFTKWFEDNGAVVVRRLNG